MKTFPTLYQKTNTGAIQQWTISVEEKMDGGLIRTEHGQVGGKLQETTDLISTGKNPGKANETTPLQQAEKEAEAKWTKQKKKGYVESLTDAQAGKVDEGVIKGGIEPMLAPSDIYPHYGKDIVFPAYVQPKFDGNRCIAVVRDGKCHLWSRTRKEIFSVPHIVAAIEKLSLNSKITDFTLDGELYNHEYRNNFEDLMSLIRPPKPVPGHEVVQYHVYDFPSCTDENGVPANFGQRHRDLGMLFTEVQAGSPLCEVKTVPVGSSDDIFREHEINLADEYEGTMVRNDGPYEQGRRSRHLQKLKTWKDGEYTIIGGAEGRGKDAGTVGAFYCIVDPTTPPVEWDQIIENIDLNRDEPRGFKARLKASYAARRKIFGAQDFVGKPLTVKYQNLTAAGKPRFPIGKGIRDYE